MRRLALAIPSALILAACIEEPPVDGRTAYMEDCAACHGTDGMGTGELAENLIQAPPDLTRLAAMNGGVFPRDYVMTTIDGYARGAHFSAAMPEFGAGDLGPTVIVEDGEGNGIPVPQRLLVLTEYLESIQRP